MSQNEKSLLRIIGDLFLSALCIIAESCISSAYFLRDQIQCIIKVFSNSKDSPPLISGQSPYDSNVNGSQNNVDVEKLWEKRSTLINSLINSEGTYRGSLETFLNIYRPAFANIISEDQKKLFFGNVEPLIILSKQYSDSFAAEYRKGMEKAEIYHCFENVNSTIKLFVPYVQSYNEIVNEYNKLVSSNKAFAKACLSITEQNSNSQFLQIIVQPVQRIGRYLVVLRDIQSSTPEIHPDHMNLKTIIEALTAATQDVERKCKEAKCRCKLIELQTIIRECPPLITPSRTFIDSYNLAEEHKVLHLMSDMLLITKNKVEKLSRKKYQTFRSQINLCDVSSATRDPTGVKLRVGSEDVLIKITENADNLLNHIDTNLRDIMLLRVRTAKTT